MLYLFIFNMTGGNKKANSAFLDKLNKYIIEKNLNSVIEITQYKGHATEIAREYANLGQAIRIFACGGDGTVNEVVSGAVGYSNVEVGIIPLGTGNDFVKTFSNKEAFFDLEKQIKANSLNIDIMKVNEKYCVNVFSVGFDAYVAKNIDLFNNVPLISLKIKYILSVIYSFIRYRSYNFKIIVDGKLMQNTDELLMCTIANGRYYGGIFNVSPHGMVDDKYLNYYHFTFLSRFKVIKLFNKYVNGEHEQLSLCTSTTAKKIYIECDKVVAFNTDGEIINQKAATVEIMEQAIKLLLPHIALCRYKNNIKENEKELIATPIATVCEQINNFEE